MLLVSDPRGPYQSLAPLIQSERYKMIEVIKHEQTTIYYKCDCGAKGMCSFRPLDKDAAIVIDVKCPACGETDRMTLLQYSNEEIKQQLLDNLNAAELSWVPSFNEELELNGD